MAGHMGLGSPCDLLTQGDRPWLTVTVLGPPLGAGAPAEVFEFPILRTDRSTKMDDIKQMIVKHMKKSPGWAKP